jgi:3-methyladenine DNA glycosylase AlkD
MPRKAIATPARSKTKRSPLRKNVSAAVELPLHDQVDAAIAALKKLSTQKDRDNLPRFGIMEANEIAGRAFGVSMSNMQKVAKHFGPSHELAAALWDRGWYEARMLASLVDDPASVTPAQMDRWCRDFDNWAICDTACFCLFDRTPHAWRKVTQWSSRREEFEKRAAFALLWGLTVHDKSADDEHYVDALALVERAASDERHFVKKGVNMALRAIGKRNAALHAAAVAAARRLTAAPHAAAQWSGKDALRELTGPSVTRRIAARRRPGIARRSKK